IGISATGTTLAYAGASQTFRGLRFGPSETAVVARPTLLYSRQANDVVLSWSGNFVLQSAAVASGPYTTVSGAPSPHSVTISSTNQFFRLSN
ncbi:MAG: hypothetical protein JWM68_5137, partial [Verrucomicrobiales bacterium]|nr:hypothetical protein [Verrucomicrobiales bacterium]